MKVRGDLFQNVERLQRLAPSQTLSILSERATSFERCVAARASTTVQAAIPLAHRPVLQRHVPPRTDPTWLGRAHV